MTVAPPALSRPVSIAVVDDEACVRTSMRRLCEAFGIRTQVFASGREFLDSLEEGGPRADCLLLDAHMPEMTGAELQRRVLARGIRIPTIVFTADDEPDNLDHFPDGVVAYLRKPLPIELLLSAIEHAVGGGEPDARARPL